MSDWLEARTEIFYLYPRQKEAFEKFDELVAKEHPAALHGLKVYSSEDCISGQRKFVVATWQKFLEQYKCSETIHGHFYEIIREDTPCRCYFDLEYTIADNPTVSGQSLMVKWINLVIWKIHEMLGICISSSDVIILDSSTPTKFSKHVIITMPAATGEICFTNNGQVGDLVEQIIRDITTSTSNLSGYSTAATSQPVFIPTAAPTISIDASEDPSVTAPPSSSSSSSPSSSLPPIASTSCRTGLDAVESMTSSESPSPHPSTAPVLPAYGVSYGSGMLRDRVPKRKYRDLWVNKQDSVDMTCIVDTSVYSRNRAFRIFGSSKFKKVNTLAFHKSDRHLTKPLYKYLNWSPKKLYAMILLKTFVIPLELPLQTGGLSTFRDINTAAVQGICELPAQPSFTDSTSRQADALVPVGVHPSDMILSQCDSSQPSSSVRATAPRPIGSMWHTTVLAEERSGTSLSPVPLVDRFVVSSGLLSGGSRVGHINGYVMYLSTSEAIRPATNSDGDMETEEENLTKRLFVSDSRCRIKIKYNVSNNKFCRNIGREHKSNGIIIEADISRGEIYQKCWDSDCHGYKSPSIRIPFQVLSEIEPSVNRILKQYKFI